MILFIFYDCILNKRIYIFFDYVDSNSLILLLIILIDFGQLLSKIIFLKMFNIYQRRGFIG